MFDLSGKTAVITGASGDIGSEIANTLHFHGAEIVISEKQITKLKILAKSLGSKCHIVKCNLNNKKEITKLIKSSKNILGNIDILVNNAGINQDNIILCMKTKNWNRVLSINLTANFLLTQLALKDMINKKSGRIINIVSITAITGNPGQSNYSASKAGIIGMSKSLAREVAARGITVNCIAPGFIKSSMTNKLTNIQKKFICSKIPIGNIGHPKDIANICLYLSSRESKYMTGQTIHINGGMTMI